MSDGFQGIKIRLTFDPNSLKADEKKIQQWVNQNLKIKIPIELDKSSLKGLDLSGLLGSTKAQVTQFQKTVDDIGKTADTTGKKLKEALTLNSKGNITKEIHEFETALGQIQKQIYKLNKDGKLEFTGTQQTTNFGKVKQLQDNLNASKTKMLSSLEQFKDIKELDTVIKQIQKSIKKLDLSDVTKSNIANVQDEINTLKLLAKEIKDNDKLREQDKKKTEQFYNQLFNPNNLTQQFAKLNQRQQSAYGLGQKVDTLAPGSDKLLQHQLNRYKNILQEFQKQNQIGIDVSPEKLAKLQNLENRIKRLYQTISFSQKDSHGFDFKQFEAFTKLSSAIKNATDKNEYYNKSIIEGTKLIKAQVQETENYIKVTQQVRQGSVHKDIGVYIDKNTGQLYKFNEGLRDATTRSWGLAEAIKTAGEKAMIWTTVMGGMYGLIGVLQQIPSIIIDIDTQLTEMSKVMDNDTNFSSLMNDLIQSSNTYGKTITQTQESMTEFARQGFQAEEAIRLTESALLGSNVTMMQTSEMAGYLTATMAQFNMTAEESVRVVDKINEVDNNYAVTSQSLAQSIAKAGESAQQYGVTLDELLGMTTAIATATKESGTVIGNSLKSLFANLSSDKAEKALKSVGIATHDVTGELRSATQIYNDIAGKWDSLSRSEKTYLGISLGNKYHLTRFLALMDNWRLALDATKTSQISLNSALEENQKHLKSLQAKIDMVKNAGQEFAYVLGEKGVKDITGGVLSVVKDFINGLTEMVNMSSMGKVALGAFGISITGIILGFTRLNTVVEASALAIRGFTIALASNPYGLLAIAIVGAVSGLAVFLGRQKQAREELEKLNQTARVTISRFNELKRLASESGTPTLQDINDTEARIQSYNKLIDKIKEVQLAKRQELMDTIKAGGSNPDGVDIELNKLDVKDAPKDLKDLAANLGLVIENYKTYGDLLNAINSKIQENDNLVKQQKQNSGEYQATQLQEARSILQNAKNASALVQEYANLSNAENLNAQQKKRLAEVTNILMALFPVEWQQGNDRIKLMEAEAQELIRKAQIHVNSVSSTMAANQQATQIAYNTAMKNIAYYQAEMNVAKQLWQVRANMASSGGTPIGGQGDKQMFDRYAVNQYYVDKNKKIADDANAALKAINTALGSTPKLSSPKLPKVGGGGGGGSSPKTGKSDIEVQVEKFESALKKAQIEYSELTKLLERKTNLGIVTGLDIFKSKLQNQEQLVNKLFDIESDLQKKLKDYQAQLGKYKAGTQQYKALQGIISLVKKDISSLPAEQEKQVAVLAKLKQQMTEIEYLTSKRSLGLKIQLGLLKGFEAEEEKINLLKTKLDGLFEQANTLNEQFDHNQEQIAANNKIARDALTNRNKFKKGTADYDKWDKINKDAVADNKKLVSLNITLGGQQKSINVTIQETNKEYDTSKEKLDKVKETTDDIASNLQSVIDRIKEINNNSKDTLIDVGINLSLNNKYGTDLFGTSEDFFDNIKSTVMEKVKGIERLKVDLANATSEGSRQLYEILHNPTSTQEDKDAILKLIDEKNTDIKDALSKAGLTEEDLIKYTDGSLQAVVDLINKQNKEMKDAQSVVDAYELELKALEDKVDAQEQLNQLKEKELKIDELQAEIDKVKADRRFEFINEQGIRTLTYDIEKVNDLEKQKLEAQNDLKEFKYQQDVDNQKKAIQDKIDAQQKYIDEELPKLQAQEMAQFTQTWLAKELATKQNEDTLTTLVKTGVLERINLYEKEIDKLKELLALQQGKTLPNLFEVQEIERTALADPNTKTVLDNVKKYNTPVTKSTINNNTTLYIGNMKFEGKYADAMYDLVKDMGITVAANA